MAVRKIYVEQEVGAVGHPIRARREAAGLSQIDLATAVGITREALNRIERGAVGRPRLVTLQAIAGVLSVNPDLLEAEVSTWREAQR